MNELLFDCIGDEEIEDETYGDEDQNRENNVDSIMLDNISYEHKDNEVVVSNNKTLGNIFLNLLCLVAKNKESDSDQGDDTKDEPL